MLLSLLALFVGLAPATYHPRVAPMHTLRDLICRGKPGIDLKLYRDPAPDDSRKVLMILRYQRADRPGRDYENLQPGECTWNPYSLPSLPAEPGSVIIEVDREAQHWSTPGAQLDTTINAAVFFPDPITLPRYLGDANHWWRFYVDDDTRMSISHGAFRATVTAPTYATVRGSTSSDAIAAVTPASPGASTRPGQSTSRSQPGAGSTYTPGGARVANIGSVGLIFRGIDRSWKQNAVRFSARANSNPTVTWSTEPPTKDAAGVLRFRAPNAWAVRATSTNGFASEYATVKAMMPTGQKTYFLISVPADRNNPVAVYSGEFTTMAQTVVVRFTKLRVLNDSDKDSAGELSFGFYMALPTQEIPNCKLAIDCMNFFGDRSWESGTTHDLANTLKLENVPDKVRVWVHGWDDDDETGAKPWVREYGPMGISWFGKPGSSISGDWNVAGREFDVSVLPTQTNFRLPFTLRSRDGFALMFEVTGEVEVTRQ